MAKTTVYIYTDTGMYYGSIRIATPTHAIMEEELVGEVTTRLPLLKKKKFTISL